MINCEIYKTEIQNKQNCNNITIKMIAYKTHITKTNMNFKTKISLIQTAEEIAKSAKWKTLSRVHSKAVSVECLWR